MCHRHGGLAGPAGSLVRKWPSCHRLCAQKPRSDPAGAVVCWPVAHGCRPPWGRGRRRLVTCVSPCTRGARVTGGGGLGGACAGECRAGRWLAGRAAGRRGHSCISGQKSAADAGKSPGRVSGCGGRMAHNARVPAAAGGGDGEVWSRAPYRAHAAHASPAAGRSAHPADGNGPRRARDGRQAGAVVTRRRTRTSRSRAYGERDAGGGPGGRRGPAGRAPEALRYSAAGAAGAIGVGSMRHTSRA